MQPVSQGTLSKRSDLQPATYSLAEFAALFGCSYTTFQEMAQRGALPVQPIRIGRQYRFAKAAVHRLLELEGDAEPLDAA